MIEGDRAQIIAGVLLVLALLFVLFSPFIAFVAALFAGVLGFFTKDEVGYPILSMAAFYGGAGLCGLIVLFSLIGWVWGAATASSGYELA